eukprot:TRINITY_DN6658_c0_g1_i1.p1 TRINITY_DN6658_c0_g1~~TRINITY_DN6658_c0_g1_i1.p1  ORF type:complete len:297 (+),score=67.28 TRINITY_DN6658_c0_g1_i1:12-902(+)
MDSKEKQKTLDSFVKVDSSKGIKRKLSEPTSSVAKKQKTEPVATPTAKKRMVAPGVVKKSTTTSSPSNAKPNSAPSTIAKNPSITTDKSKTNKTSPAPSKGSGTTPAKPTPAPDKSKANSVKKTSPAADKVKTTQSQGISPKKETKPSPTTGKKSVQKSPVKSSPIKSSPVKSSPTKTTPEKKSPSKTKQILDSTPVSKPSWLSAPTSQTPSKSPKSPLLAPSSDLKSSSVLADSLLFDDFESYQTLLNSSSKTYKRKAVDENEKKDTKIDKIMGELNKIKKKRGLNEDDGSEQED